LIIKFASTNKSVEAQLSFGAVRRKTVKLFTQLNPQIFEATAAVGLFRQDTADLLLECAVCGR
jgi:hypothetical protein